jgi:hypothetical protein
MATKQRSAATDRRTPGQTAYEAELLARPCYDNGSQRCSWADLGKLERSTWEKNPTPRWTATKRD